MGVGWGQCPRFRPLAHTLLQNWETGSFYHGLRLESQRQGMAEGAKGMGQLVAEMDWLALFKTSPEGAFKV